MSCFLLKDDYRRCRDLNTTRGGYAKMGTLCYYPTVNNGAAYVDSAVLNPNISCNATYKLSGNIPSTFYPITGSTWARDNGCYLK